MTTELPVEKKVRNENAVMADFEQRVKTVQSYSLQLYSLSSSSSLIKSFYFPRNWRHLISGTMPGESSSGFPGECHRSITNALNTSRLSSSSK